MTRERLKAHRIACPWLIRRFIDPEVESFFVPADQAQVVANSFRQIYNDDHEQLAAESIVCDALSGCYRHDVVPASEP